MLYDHLFQHTSVIGESSAWHKKLRIQIDCAVWQFPCWVIITLVVFSFFPPTGAVLHSQICCKKVVIDRRYLWAPLFSLQASCLTFHIAPAWAVLWFICNWSTHRREKGRKKIKTLADWGWHAGEILHWVMEREREAVAWRLWVGGKPTHCQDAHKLNSPWSTDSHHSCTFYAMWSPIISTPDLSEGERENSAKYAHIHASIHYSTHHRLSSMAVPRPQLPPSLSQSRSLSLCVRGKSQALISYDLCHCYSCQLEAVRKEPRSSCANANMPVLPRTRHLDGSPGISQHVLFFLCNQTAVWVWKYIVQRK